MAIIESITPGKLLPSDNIKRFSGKTAAKGYDPGVCPWRLGSHITGSVGTLRIDSDRRLVILSIAQSGGRIYASHREVVIGRICPDKGFVFEGVAHNLENGNRAEFTALCRLMGTTPERLYKTAAKWCTRYLREYPLQRPETQDSYCRNGEFVRRQQCKRKAKRRRKKMQRIAIR
jgi:hypothetical protein